MRRKPTNGFWGRCEDLVHDDGPCVCYKEAVVRSSLAQRFPALPAVAVAVHEAVVANA